MQLVEKGHPQAEIGLVNVSTSITGPFVLRFRLAPFVTSI